MERSITAGGIESRILWLRGQKILLDHDLAELYGVTTSRLNEQVKRNINRFPPDFMFQLNASETRSLRSQIAISNVNRGGSRVCPYAFTEHGVAMLASVIRSERAIQVNIAIVRAFVRMREFLATHQGLAKKLAKLEQKYDSNFQVVFDAIEHLMETGESKRKRKIGFAKENE